ncbi:MAG TPA: prenyltransferase/squalene oxidase repeat-containing protein [Rhodothermales bacterium]|nr:prenyltransferase/squalene oxidase repeat-containing protein [Rhodothermales bacterium]
MKTLPSILLVIAVSACNQMAEPTSVTGRLISRSCDYLVDAQAEDGGWHSVTHGLMSSGQATTPFVLYALLSAPDSVCVFRQEARDAAARFIRSRVADNGALGVFDPDILDFPNYATAYAVMSLAWIGEPDDEQLLHRMADYLVAQQIDENRGADYGHPAYGGWGFGETVFPQGSFGHVDLSHTRRVVQAIRASGHSNEETYRQAMAYLRLHQRHPSDPRVQRVLGDSAGAWFDGGFFASASVPVVNKSTLLAVNDEIALFTSYASATADGLLALLATGHDRSDPSVVAAYRWLEEHADFSYPQGIPTDHPSRWGEVMFFYHLMVRGEAYRAMEIEGPWRDGIISLIADKQRADGSFSNPHGAPNKEDDPHLATAMVLIALS